MSSSICNSSHGKGGQKGTPWVALSFDDDLTVFYRMRPYNLEDVEKLKRLSGTVFAALRSFSGRKG